MQSDHVSIQQFLMLPAGLQTRVEMDSCFDTGWTESMSGYANSQPRVRVNYSLDLKFLSPFY